MQQKIDDVCIKWPKVDTPPESESKKFLQKTKTSQIQDSETPVLDPNSKFEEPPINNSQNEPGTDIKIERKLNIKKKRVIKGE